MTQEKPEKTIWTFDCETDPFERGLIVKPFLWGFYNPERGYFQFRRTKDAIRFIEENPGIYYAHNGGKFDFHFIADALNINERILIIHNRLVSAKIADSEIRDSYAILPFSLKEYQKTDIDYNKLKKNVRRKHMAEISHYLKTDCVFLYEIVSDFLNKYGMHMTAAGAAIKTLMKIEDLKIENSGSGFYEEFKPYYYGGRCECLKSGTHKGGNGLVYLDINSAYPFAMKHQHPIGSVFFETFDKKPNIKPQGFYTVSARSFGAFCRRTKSGLKFDHDGIRREYTTTGHELIAAIDTGLARDIKHIKQIVFAETRNFSTYIDYFWMIRKTTKKGTPDNLFAKLLMNSAYGKLAADPSQYECFEICENKDLRERLEKRGFDIVAKINQRRTIISRPNSDDFMRYYNVATGASITGFVRAMLMRAIAAAETPIYCDTDSLIYMGECDLPLGAELGQWKVEGTFKEGHFAGKKCYALKNGKNVKTASKGGQLSFNEIKKIVSGKTVTYKQIAPSFSWLTGKTTFLERKIKKTA